MKFTVSIAMNPIDQIVELAKTAERCGFHSIALPDSIFYSEKVSADYPYTPDGSRMWTKDTPWVDPLIAAAAMGAATERIRFCTQVLKLGSRQPLPLARQVGSVANLTGNRFTFGVGLGWSPEEFEWCGVPFERRGKRADEFLDILQAILAGGMVAHHGEFYDFDELQMSPAPSEPIPIFVGGHTEAGLRRAARYDGWTSAMIKYTDLKDVINTLGTLRKENGRADEPFEIQAICVDRFGLDGYRQLEDIGVTDSITVPWAFDGIGFDGDLRAKQDSIEKFADEIISRMGER
ncbi:TIGR03619 family F420-dependent LLM class oxidoreductase [Pseudonocardia spinosispora]|uniref:TIGR03619 family F420-dependent LLM class oxidoreductase n=1 Tax=Pseudonocardia spinosispora TaxID=103441 RepID=UPI0004021A56|nr:TIGR03619 family F420-dependent LLM class oxidoreductase [Pseudonocardia spinosispora]